jgi:hypothetical protein
MIVSLVLKLAGGICLEFEVEVRFVSMKWVLGSRCHPRSLAGRLHLDFLPRRCLLYLPSLSLLQRAARPTFRC